MLETGPGYTLSGKDLDPESAAAKPYLKGMSLPYPVQSGNPLPVHPPAPVEAKKESPKKQEPKVEKKRY